MTASYRALHFAGVGAGAPAGTASPAGTTMGLNVTATGGLAMVEGDDSIRQAILLLLSTRPGERLMRPTYGSQLHRLVFAPNDQTTAGLAIHYVRDAVQRWEPRVDVLTVDADADPRVPERLNVELHYLVRSSLATDVVHFQLDLEPVPGEVAP
ncbi:GPW/gp25 family protein [Actinopolymorpha alba]|uniref:GPW/gp25 family protein n=1 Tax=Actinopolymorpha alba TaxID=533267 RepID=UPI00035F1457|nr:GPW/gp25 family protein [Actinopolymorpha alba]